MSEPTTQPEQAAPAQPPNIAREPATVEACQDDFAEGAAERAAFDAGARRNQGDG